MIRNVYLINVIKPLYQYLLTNHNLIEKVTLKNIPELLRKDIPTSLNKLKIDLLYFLPGEKQVYPKGVIIKILKLIHLKKDYAVDIDQVILKAVVDVIDRFIKIIRPKKIYFGEKDMQQLKIIDDFVKEKSYLRTKVISCKTIRERKW